MKKRPNRQGKNEILFTVAIDILWCNEVAGRWLSEFMRSATAATAAAAATTKTNNSKRSKDKKDSRNESFAANEIYYRLIFTLQMVRKHKQTHTDASTSAFTVCLSYTICREMPNHFKSAKWQWLSCACEWERRTHACVPLWDSICVSSFSVRSTKTKEYALRSWKFYFIWLFISLYISLDSAQKKSFLFFFSAVDVPLLLLLFSLAHLHLVITFWSD